MAGGNLELAHSVLDWWSLAGVDCDFVDEPATLLVAPAQSSARSPGSTPVPPAGARSSEPRTLPEAKAEPAPVASGRFTPPDTLPELRAWLATSPDVPGAGPPSNRVAASGPDRAELFVLTAAPDAVDLIDGHVLGGAPGALFDRMLGAIDLRRDQVAIASMAVSPLAGTRLAAEEIAALADIARHHIALVAPRIVLILGDKASRALLATDVVTARGKLLEIKVKSAIITTVATFHPRTLERNQRFKRAAWESLLQVKEELTRS
jgi:DNA polymerase